MKIALAVAPVKNKNIDFNANTMLKYMEQAKGEQANMVLFGEAFLQGFECLSWQREIDRDICIDLNDEIMMRLREACKNLEIALGFGYLEKEGDKFYSSYLVIDHKGKDLSNYRRLSVGWREPISDDEFYLEGTEFKPFKYLNNSFVVELCGDFWHEDIALKVPRNVDAILWPVFVHWRPEEWEAEEFEAYVQMAKTLSDNVLYVNSICVDENSPAHGGAFSVIDGKLENSFSMGREGILFSKV